MKDGNKESTKELLSTFRTLFALGGAVILLVIGLRTRGFRFYSSDLLMDICLMAATVSLSLMVYLFFVVIGKVHREAEDIVYQPDVLALSMLALLLFFGAHLGMAANMLLA